MDDSKTSQERELVEALMLRGWYREGRIKVDADGRGLWKFRFGHSLDESDRQTILVRARSQQAAMRALLARLEEGETEPDLAATSG